MVFRFFGVKCEKNQKQQMDFVALGDNNHHTASRGHVHGPGCRNHPSRQGDHHHHQHHHGRHQRTSTTQGDDADGDTEKFNVERFKRACQEMDPHLKLTDVLGKGAFGVVFAGKRKGQRVAVKGERRVEGRRMSLRQEVNAYIRLTGTVTPSHDSNNSSSTSRKRKRPSSSSSSSSSSSPKAGAEASQDENSDSGRGQSGNGSGHEEMSDDHVSAEDPRHRRGREQSRLVRYTGVPQLEFFRTNHSLYRFAIFEQLGPSLKTLLRQNKGKFSVGTVALIAVQMLAHLEFIHIRGIVHRDIKPANIVIGHEDHAEGPRRTYLIDFGLSKAYINFKTGKHLRHRKDRGSPGTVRYMSLATHQGHEVSRRDDLQSLAYTLVFLAKGKLPWQKIKRHKKDGEHDGANVAKKEQYELVYNMKKKMSARQVCDRLPRVFADFLRYSIDLDFDADPNYEHFQREFYSVAEPSAAAAMLEQGEDFRPSAFHFDWNN